MTAASGQLDLAAVKSRSVQGAAVTVLSQMLRFAIQFGSQVALARTLDPSTFGLLAMAAPVLLFVQTVNDLGFGQAIIQRPAIAQNQVSAMFWIGGALSCALTGLLLLAAPAFGWFYGEALVTPVTRVLAALVLVAGITVVPTALLNRRMRFVPLAVADICSVSAGAAAGIVGALNGWGVWSLVLMQVVTSVVMLVLCWSFAAWRPSWPGAAPELRGLLRFGAHLTGANLATYCSTSLDRVLIGAAAGTVALGLYDRSYRLVVQPLTQLMTPVSRVAVPMLARLNGSDPQFARSYLYMLQFTLLATIPVMLVNIVLARPIVSLIFGTQWADAAPIFAWICVGGLASSSYSSTAWIFTSQGRTREQMYFNVAASAINVASFAVGVAGGAVGVAAVSGVSFVLLQTPLLMWGATRRGAVSTGAVLRAVLPFLAAAAGAASLLAVVPRSGDGDLAQVLTSEVLAHAAFVAVLLCQPAGRTFLRDTWNLRHSMGGRRQ